MDKSVYRSFEHHWDQELIKYVNQQPERTLNKTSFNFILSQVWPKCMTINNIVNGFRATELYPFNPDAIPEEAFAPSVLSEFPNPTSGENVEAADSREVCVAEESEGSSCTDTENLPLSLLSSKYCSETPQKEENHIETKSEIHEFLPTPKFKISQSAPRKKSLNYKAQEVTKDLFGDVKSSTSQPHTSRPTPTAISGTPLINLTAAISTAPQQPENLSSEIVPSLANPTVSSKSKTAKSNRKPKLIKTKRDNMSSWYCPACKEDRVDDMRQCLTCNVWYHELCVGLTPDDKEFYCSGECIKKKIKKLTN